MGSSSDAADGSRKPHAVLIPYPAQGHINPLLKFAKILHHKGFHITFVNTHYNHRRLIKSHGASVLSGLQNFRFTSIPDGLPPSEADVTQDIPSLCRATTNFLEPFCELIEDLNKAGGDTPPVSVLVVDGVMSFAQKAGERFGVPAVVLWTASACGLVAYREYRRLVDDGLVPLKDMEDVNNGYLNRVVDGIPGVERGLQLRDFPSFIRTTDREDIMLRYLMQEAEAALRGKALIFNTIYALEEPVLVALAEISPSIYTIGPLHLLVRCLPDSPVKAIGSSLWKVDHDCTKWLDGKPPGSVLYVNFGSIAVVTAAQLTEFAWGLANSGSPFLWVIRPDIVSGDSAMLPPEFLEETKERSLLISWCAQEEVLEHRAIGGFLTHSGWNSTVESISSGVPVICWPFFAEQQTNCRFSCVEWGIGMEIDNDVKREEVEMLVREVMGGEKGKKMKENVKEWRKKVEAEAAPGGLSEVNLNKLIEEVMMH